MRFHAGQLVIIYDQADASGVVIDEQQGMIIGEAYLDDVFAPKFDHDDARLRFYDVLVGGRVLTLSDIMLDVMRDAQ